MEVKFIVETEITLDCKPGRERSKLLTTSIHMDASDNIDISVYNDSNGYPNKEGGNVITNVLVQGLVLNIHKCHKEGFRNDAEHLRYIISELERGFVENVELRND